MGRGGGSPLAAVPLPPEAESKPKAHQEGSHESALTRDVWTHPLVTAGHTLAWINARIHAKPFQDKVQETRRKVRNRNVHRKLRSVVNTLRLARAYGHKPEYDTIDATGSTLKKVLEGETKTVLSTVRRIAAYVKRSKSTVPELFAKIDLDGSASTQAIFFACDS